jgi:hypothetical protein
MAALGQSEKIQHVSDGGCFLRKQPWRPLPHMKPKTWERCGLKSWIRAEASAPQRARDRARRGPAFALTLLFNGAALASVWVGRDFCNELVEDSLPERIEVPGDHDEGPRAANHIVSVVIFETARDVTPRHSGPRG